MLPLFAAALCGQFVAQGHHVSHYWRCPPAGRAFWNAKAVEVLPGVLAAMMLRDYP